MRRQTIRLPSRPQSITALWLVPNCTAWWQRHMGVSKLPRVVAWWCAGLESNPRPLGHESDTPTTPPSHPSNEIRYINLIFTYFAYLHSQWKSAQSAFLLATQNWTYYYVTMFRVRSQIHNVGPNDRCQCLQRKSKGGDAMDRVT